MSRLNGKVALITGVGSGIGLAAARLFCQEGAIVFGVDVNADAGEALAAELHSKNHVFYFYRADLSTAIACATAVAECSNRFDRIDVLYNNVGISAVKPFLETDESVVNQILAVNFMSVFHLCQQVIPLMQQQGSGTIINTASELAIVAQPFYSAYCASKGAVLSFTRALALEYAQANIRINALCPGPIDTPMLQREFETETDAANARNLGVATMPIGRFGQPEEIAQVALFLASEAPALLHGASVVVDGAKTIF
ncbi:SDR family oxidoreductase [Oculatella sp. LEGE 06141]|uniref:SDR family NAD(P)-dependent oxidoreductase n=1 Tax=Oculatella sp. LEGE 06141 TaxID=1828648 RepID=UPI00187FCE3B|nr:SDR family oxidoreductase [Oculatella sp. LEGE 06141]MBE9180362.1 SDR family oxidoreductase [Oculatella sp. LEGE 06141]